MLSRPASASRGVYVDVRLRVAGTVMHERGGFPDSSSAAAELAEGRSLASAVAAAAGASSPAGAGVVSSPDSVLADATVVAEAPEGRLSRA